MFDYIGRFEVLEKIGEGGMGAVYKALDPGINRIVAIKLLREGFDSIEMRERFMQEARSAGGLQNPNIVTIFDLGQHGDAPFIVMEFVVGETMDRQIRRRAPLRLVRKLELMEALCSGLGFAHRAGIVHRDIKPANLIVSNDGILKILDFGIARVSNSELTKTGALIGTPNYMAPEQLLGEPVDRRADIFAVGAVFYELLTYQRAFPGTFTEAITRVLHREPESLSRLVEGLDPQIEATVARALNKSADRRYQELSEMRRDIVRIRQRLERDAPETLAQTHYEQTSIVDLGSALKDPGRPGIVDGGAASRAAAEVDAANQQFERGETAQAIERLEAFDPPTPFVSEALVALRERADQLERQAQRSAAVSRAVDAASNAFGRGDYDSAIRYADEALLVDERSAPARDLRRRSRAALDEQRRLAEVERRVGRAIAEARERFVTGERQAAIDGLTAFQPAHTAISDALSVLRAEAAAILRREQEEAQRQRAGEERQRAEEERLRLEAAERRVEEERLRLEAAERQRAEEERLRLEAAKRQRAEEERLRLEAAERKRAEEEQRRAEEVERKRVEARRLEEERLAAEERRIAEEHHLAEQQRREEERRKLEAERIAKAARREDEVNRERFLAEQAAREREAQVAREAEVRKEQQQREATAVPRARPAETVALPTITPPQAQPASQPMAVRVRAVAAGIALVLAIGYGVVKMRTPSTTGTDRSTSTPTTSDTPPAVPSVDRTPTPLTNPPVQPSPNSTTAAGPEAPPSVPAPAGAALPITIDALPWANVEITPVGQTTTGEIRKGTTPYIVDLPAGDYTVRLTNPQLARPVTQRITVGPNVRRAFQFTLPGLDPDKIVEEILSK